MYSDDQGVSLAMGRSYMGAVSRGLRKANISKIEIKRLENDQYWQISRFKCLSYNNL